MSRPKRVGIVASDCYFPSTYVSQASLEKHDGVSAGKYEVGLGQNKMSFTGAGEDINSMCLSAITGLMEKYNLNHTDIGRIEIGTETILDKSKSTKTTLMGDFIAAGNSDILGVTNINACYGGTAALFNTIDWVESTSWDGRYGIVLMGDIAVYEKGPARPTGGAGVVALLVGPEAPLVFENKLRASHFEDAYDFYKPNLASEYPAVDGHLSNACYLRSVDKCYQLYADKFERLEGKKFDMVNGAQRYLFHQPYAKLVQKSFGRVMYNDVTRGVLENEEISKFRNVEPEASYTDRALDKACVGASSDLYKSIVYPYTMASRNIGNSYAGSLYFGLLSLIADETAEKLGDRVLMFSYGSGLAASMFSLIIDGSLKNQREVCNLKERLDNERVEISAEKFTQALAEREEFYNAKSFAVNSPPKFMSPGASYLSGVDALGRRSYQRVPAVRTLAAATARQMHTLVRRFKI